MTYDAKEKSQRGGAPVELYKFSVGGVPAAWYTSADSDQLYAGDSYTAVTISRGTIDNNDEDQRGELEVTVARDLDVAVLFIPDLPPKPVTLTVYRFHRGDSGVIVLWSGQVAAATFKGSEVTLTALPESRSFRRTIPSNRFQAQCNWALFSAQCGLDKNAYKVTATPFSVVGVSVRAVVFGTYAAGYFRNGWIEDVNGESHWIVEHLYDTLTLLTPFRSLVSGQTVYVFPGCDRTVPACKAYGNLIHFSGFPQLPTKNPFVRGLL